MQNSFIDWRSVAGYINIFEAHLAKGFIMKLLNTIALSTLLSIGLVGHAMAAQGHDVKSPGKAKISKVVVKSAGHKNVKKTYRVTRGDTLYRIAAKTKVPVAKLMKLNNLTKKQANKLKVGSIIRLS